MSALARSPARCYACSGLDHEPALDLGEVRIVRCRACGFHLVSPRVDDAELERVLQSWAARDVLDPERLEEAHSEAAARFWRGEARRLHRLLGRGGRLLDVGCATGAFLRAAQEEGFAATGIERGDASSDYARRRLGLAVVSGDFLQARLEEASFVAVTLYEVIEHLPDPLAVLREAHRVLARGGVVAISTPNLASLTARLLGRRWWPINRPDEHIHLFTPATVRELMRRAGFAAASWRTSGLDLLLWARVASGGEAGWEATAGQRRRLRNGAARKGVLGLLRACKRALDLPFAMRWSPLRGAGERLFAYGLKE